MRSQVQETIEWLNDPMLLHGFRSLLKERWNVSLEEWIVAQRFSTKDAFLECLDLKETIWNLLIEAGNIPASVIRGGDPTWERSAVIAGLRMLGVVYFAELHDFIKIGFSGQLDPRSRVDGLETSSPYDITFLHSIPGSMRTERFLHRKFAALHHKREWFRRDDSLLEFIETLKP